MFDFVDPFSHHKSFQSHQQATQVVKGKWTKGKMIQIEEGTLTQAVSTSPGRSTWIPLPKRISILLATSSPTSCIFCLAFSSGSSFKSDAMIRFAIPLDTSLQRQTYHYARKSRWGQVLRRHRPDAVMASCTAT